MGLEELEEPTQLLVSEVVTNAILHAGTRMRVLLRAEGEGVRVEVSDDSTSEPVRRQHSSLATIGRGLGMLDRLAQDWGWTMTSAGKTVWFVVCPERDATTKDQGGRGEAGAARVSARRGQRGLLGSVPATQDDQRRGVREAESGLGRYAAGMTGDVIQVHLVGLPVRLLVASQEHHDALIREFRLMALAPEEARQAATGGLNELVEELGIRHAAARARRDGEIQDALDAGLLQIDQVFPVPVTAAEELSRLVAVLSQADRYCDDNLLLTLARPPLVRRFSDWYLGEILGQIDGRPPVPWTGPATLSSAER